MATLTITIADAELPRVREAMCAFGGFTDPADVTNANARLALIRAVKNIVRTYERDKAIAAAETGGGPDPNVT